VFNPLLCDRLLCGQKHQTMFQIEVPEAFIGRAFVDLFRAFLSKSVSNESFTSYIISEEFIVFVYLKSDCASSLSPSSVCLTSLT
jgi:hypothetical protein